MMLVHTCNKNTPCTTHQIPDERSPINIVKLHYLLSPWGIYSRLLSRLKAGPRPVLQGALSVACVEPQFVLGGQQEGDNGDVACIDTGDGT